MHIDEAAPSDRHAAMPIDIMQLRDAITSAVQAGSRRLIADFMSGLGVKGGGEEKQAAVNCNVAQLETAMVHTKEAILAIALDSAVEVPSLITLPSHSKQFLSSLQNTCLSEAESDQKQASQRASITLQTLLHQQTQLNLTR